MKTLDLHGVRHEDAVVKVENFIINVTEPRAHIICGSSPTMLKIAKSVLERLGYTYYEGVGSGYGRIEVMI